MILIPLGVVFAGYQLMWYGYANLKGPNMGFLDLLLPTRTGKASAVIATWGTGGGAPSGAATGAGAGAGAGAAAGGQRPANANPGTRPAQGQF